MKLRQTRIPYTGGRERKRDFRIVFAYPISALSSSSETDSNLATCLTMIGVTTFVRDGDPFILLGSSFTRIPPTVFIVTAATAPDEEVAAPVAVTMVVAVFTLPLWLYVSDDDEDEDALLLRVLDGD